MQVFRAKNQQFCTQPIHRQSNQQSHHATKAIQPESINQKRQLAHSKNLHAPHVERICRAIAILKLLVVWQTAAYSAYVRIWQTRQMPKEPTPLSSHANLALRYFICRDWAILKLLAVWQTAAYSAYVRIWQTRQTPKEPVYANKKGVRKIEHLHQSNLSDYLFFLS